MQWTTLAAFVGLELVLCFTPGPAVMAVVGAALAHGGAGMATVLGILTGNSILPQFINPYAALIPQIIILGVASLAVELAVLSTYAAAAKHIRDRGISARSRVWAERAGGICLLGVAAAVVRESV